MDPYGAPSVFLPNIKSTSTNSLKILHLNILYVNKIGTKSSEIFCFTDEDELYVVGKLLWGLQKIRSSLKNVVYEAVPAGYSLVRLLRSAGLPAEVLTAGKTPRMTDYSLFPGHAATDVTELHNEVEQKGKGAFERKLSALITDTRSVLE